MICHFLSFLSLPGRPLDNRKFFSAANECKSNCRYCFSKWENYAKYSQFTCETIDENDLIIYPCCDGNIFDDSFNKLLADFLNLKNRTVISISTKNNISEEQMNKLVKIDKMLKSNNKGFLKLSVSFSCQSMINNIEQDTLIYSERLALIKSIIDRGLTYATILKPLLPFISIEEYKKIIDDTVLLSSNYIIGGLYINRSTDFFNEYNLKNYSIYEKTVTWAHGNPTWQYIEDTNMKNQICDYILNSGGRFYDSDADFIMGVN